MKKQIITILFNIGIIAIACAQHPIQTDTTKQQNPEQKKQADADFKFVNTEYDFGTIEQGDSVKYNFKFKNIGKDPLIIYSATATCGCTIPQYPKEPIKKGKNGVIKVTFNSADKFRKQDKTITINSNGKTNPIVLHLKGNVNVSEERMKNPPIKK